MKQCSKCEKWRPFECYSTVYGKHKASCKQCTAADLKAFRDSKRNPEACKPSTLTSNFNNRIYGTRDIDKI